MSREEEARALVYKIEMEAIAQVKEPGYEMLYDKATQLILDFLAAHAPSKESGGEVVGEVKGVIHLDGVDDYEIMCPPGSLEIGSHVTITRPSTQEPDHA